MLLGQENRSTRRKACASATLSTIYLTSTDHGSKAPLRGETKTNLNCIYNSVRTAH
jgi:hypothetical protein